MKVPLPTMAEPGPGLSATVQPDATVHIVFPSRLDTSGEPVHPPVELTAFRLGNEVVVTLRRPNERGHWGYEPFATLDVPTPKEAQA